MRESRNPRGSHPTLWSPWTTVSSVTKATRRKPIPATAVTRRFARTGHRQITEWGGCRSTVAKRAWADSTPCLATAPCATSARPVTSATAPKSPEVTTVYGASMVMRPWRPCSVRAAASVIRQIRALSATSNRLPGTTEEPGAHHSIGTAMGATCPSAGSGAMAAPSVTRRSPRAMRWHRRGRLMWSTQRLIRACAEHATRRCPTRTTVRRASFAICSHIASWIDRNRGRNEE